MTPSIKTIAIIGDGAWGTTLAVYLGHKGHPVKLWGAFPEYTRRVRINRYNYKYLPGIRIPDNVEPVENLKTALEGAHLVILAFPSKFAIKILRKLKKCELKNKMFLSVIKGIDHHTHLRISQMIERELGKVPLAVLSGPTIAMEVAKGIPSTAVVASRNKVLARNIQSILNSEKFRIYTNDDVPGVELGGSVKNIIAIACGVCDGLGLGSNTKAAILTRGLAEMARLGKTFGAKEKTFAGLSGLGDLVTTCISPQSRNRYVGEQLGKGRKITEIVSSMNAVAEGIVTSKAVLYLSRKYRVEMPITSEVYNIIYRAKKPAKAMEDLMSRKMKPE